MPWERYLRWFDEECPRSRAVSEEAKALIQGGVQHNLAFNYPFPLAIDRAEGPYLYDIDGHRFIDFLQAGGPTILGSNDPVVREHVMEVLDRAGPSTGLFHGFELRVSFSHRGFAATALPSRIRQPGGCSSTWHLKNRESFHRLNGRRD